MASHSFRNASLLGGHRLVSTTAALASPNHEVLDLVDQPVVLGVEDVVDGGQADVLVPAAVAGDEVRVEQLVVVGACCLRLPPC